MLIYLTILPTFFYQRHPGVNLHQTNKLLNGKYGNVNTITGLDTSFYFSTNGVENCLPLVGDKEKCFVGLLELDCGRVLFISYGNEFFDSSAVEQNSSLWLNLADIAGTANLILYTFNTV